jgi:hypothetical protein
MARKTKKRRRDPGATPAAVNLAKRLDVDLETITGTGARGRIVVGDVRKAAPPARVGQPPKLEQILPDGRRIFDAIVDAVRGGAYMEHAAAYAGVAESSLYLWRAKGREWIGVESDEVPDEVRLYVEFSEALEKARGTAIVASVGRIREAGQGTPAREGRAARDPDWKADAWWLERTMPDKFGRRLALREEAGGGKPEPIDEDRVKAHDDALLAAYEDELPDLDGDLAIAPPALSGDVDEDE